MACELVSCSNEAHISGGEMNRSPNYLCLVLVLQVATASAQTLDEAKQEAFRFLEEDQPRLAMIGGRHLQLFGARLSGVQRIEASHRPIGERRIQRRARCRRHAHRLRRDLRLGPSGDRSHGGYRRASRAIAKAGSRLSRSADRGCAGTWRRPQHESSGGHWRRASRQNSSSIATDSKARSKSFPAWRKSS